MKQILYIHGGDSFPTRKDMMKYWEQWSIENPFERQKQKKWRENVREELTHTHLLVDPEMPNSMNAHYDEWAMWFEKYFPFFKEGIILIGHSLGANFLAKYLAENTLPVHISQLHLVAGCFGEGDFDLPNSLENVSKQSVQIFIYHSHDDDVVAFSDAEKFKKALPTAELIEFEDRGHFFAQDTFPEIVENIRSGKY